MGNVDEALKNLNMALEIQPSNIAAIKSKMALLFEFQRWDEALDWIDYALRWDPGSADEHNLLKRKIKDGGKFWLTRFGIYCDRLCKVVQVGELHVGKTEIARALVGKEFGIQEPITIGGGGRLYRRVTQRNFITLLETWDTCGAERFTTMSRAYFRHSTIVLLIYDVTRRETFSQLSKWIHNIEQHVDSGALVILIGNKAAEGMSREVTFEEGQTLAKLKLYVYLETSAKLGQNIDNLMNFIIEWCSQTAQDN